MQLIYVKVGNYKRYIHYLVEIVSQNYE